MITILFVLSTLGVNAQTFTEQTGIVLPGISDGTTLWGDADNDGDIDILIAGYDAGNIISVKLYRNNGSNTYSEALNVFSPAIPSAWGSFTMSAQWADLDNDGFLDIIINAPNSSDGNFLLIYQHQADHSYLLKNTISFWTWQGNSIDCGDYDNDGDQDILLCTNSSSRIFSNSGGFVFNEVVSIPLEGLTEGYSRFGDFDNDGDLDILITGFKDGSYSGTIRIYKNNGNNSFSLLAGLPFSGSFDGSSEWGDYNNDGYLDILITGKYGNTKIYKNNGNETFSFQSLITIPEVIESTGKWGDLDNDGDLDIVISGNSNNTPVTKAFINNGNNTFTELAGFGVTGLKKSSADLMDYDNDGDLDILISGNNGTSGVTKVFSNSPSGANPLPAAPTGLIVTTSGNNLILSWNQVVSDNTPAGSISYNVMVGTSAGGINIVSPNSNTTTGMHRISGMGNAQLGTSFVLRNLQRGVTYFWRVQAIDNSWKGSTFASGPNFTYTPVIQSSGLNVPEKDGASAKFTWNRGNGTACVVFLKEANSGTAAPSNGTVYAASPVFKSGSQIGSTGWYCIYNGTLNTVNVTNLKANTDYIFQVIEYTGTTYDNTIVTDNPLTFKTGAFTEIKSANLLPVSRIDLNNNPIYACWVDIDNDSGNDLDLILQGPTNTRLYRNDGSGIFTLLATPFVSGSSASVGDFNNDGLPDLAIGGYPNNVLYRNTGSGSFTEQPGAFPLTSEYGTMDWGDYDNDGDPDMLSTGTSSTEGNTSKIFRNDGAGVFTEQQSVSLPGVAYGQAKWVDYDNDGLLDFFLSGSTNSASPIAKIFRNNGKNNFTEQTSIVLPASSYNSVDWGDYNSDGLIDLIYSSSSFTRIYRNNGDHTFAMQTITGLPVVSYGSVKWGDYDNDGDLDVLLSGFSGVYRSQITKIFRNDGNNTFTEDLTAVLPGIGSGIAAWGDYDKDGDLDIVLSGNSPDATITRIYRNDNGTVNNAPAAPAGISATVNKSDVTLKWKSVRTDNTPYKAMTYNVRTGTAPGAINILSPNSAGNGLRRIVAQGNASLDTTFLFRKMPFGTYYWSVQAVDNGFSGSPFSSEGSFTVSPVQAQALSARIINNNSLVLKWERGNGDRCVVFAKQTSTGVSVPVNNTGYVADPEMGFGSQIGSSGWYCIYNGRGDSVVVSGLVSSKLYSFHIIEYMGTFGSEQYFTVTADGNPGVFSTSLFTEQSGITLNAGLFNNVAWGDYDKDGFIDILIPGIPSTRIYRNNGNNTFTEKTTISLPPVDYGSAAWGDYDRDGDLDIIITGSSSSYPVSNPVTKIFRNDGADIFTEQTSIAITPLFYSSVAWGDYDSDGDLDILINGAYGTAPNYTRVSKIYENNGNSTFTEQPQIVLQGLYRGSVRWVDYDNDGDLDIAMTGAQMETQFNTEGVFLLYKNNGDKSFTEQTVTGIFRQASNSSTTWGDFDNDGDNDFIMTARGFMILYRNMGGNNFTTHLDIILPFQGACYSAWGDYDNDGFLDIILTNPGLDTKIYRNTQGKTLPGALSQWFIRKDDDAVQSIGYSFVNWIDYDNDGDLDFLISKDYGSPSKIFKNNLVMRSALFKPNTPPSVPSGTDYSNTPQGVILRWNSPADNETPKRTLSYNLKIGTTKTNFNITPAHSSSSGYREVPAMGNAQLDTTYLMINMPAMKYYWSVQAVDQALMGGAWSPVDSFEVKSVLAFFSADTVCQGLPTSFTNQSVAFGETIQSYKWIFDGGATTTLTDPQYTFGSSGTKNVTLIAFSQTSSDTLVKTIIVKGKPITDFNASVACLGTETTFTNTSVIAGLTISSWSWDYGDGKGSTAMNPGTHGYLNAGAYDVILTATADNNCSESITKTVTVAAYPVASISATTPLSFCAGDSVALSVVTDPNFTYRWMSNEISITGGTTSRQVARVTGNYTVEIVNLTGNCKTTSAPAVVTVLSAPAAPLITYSSTDNSTTICQNDSLLLNVTNTAGYTYQWKLNGGAIGTNSNRYYSKNAGDYTVVVANSNGCSVSSTNKVTITVNPLPVVGSISKEGKTKLCEGESVTLSVPASPGYLYSWKDASGPIPGSTTNSFIASQTGAYQLEVTNTLGCKVITDAVPVEVGKTPLKPSIDKGSYNEGTCLGSIPIKLSVADVTEGYSYRWYKNGAPVSNSSFIEGFPEFGYYYVEADLAGCKNHSDSIKVNSESAPDKPVLSAKGPTIWYLSSSIANAVEYKWYFYGQLIPEATASTYVAYQNLGVYRVGISYDRQCFSFSDTVRIPKGITGIEDIDPFRDVKIYPNPTTGLFTLEMKNNVFGEIIIDIFTQNGSKILNIKFEKTTEHFYSQIDLSGQAGGMYILNLSLDKFRAVRKVLVE